MLALVDHHLVQLTLKAGRSSVPVSVVHIGRVRMDMLQRRVAAPVAVRVLGHQLVPVIVVPIVVPMRVFVLQRHMLVLVAMRLSQVQHHPDQHQYAAQRHPAAARAVAQQQRQGRADKGREGKNRAGARCAEGSLREQAKTQAQAIAGRADDEQAECRCR
jgi:hypothetical protein